MNNKAEKAKENNENLCPFTRTRLPSKGSTTQTPTWKLDKLETTLGLTMEYLAEMGIGILDSEESSSSAASTLAVSSNTDENSKEATSYLDAPNTIQKQKSAENFQIPQQFQQQQQQQQQQQHQQQQQLHQFRQQQQAQLQQSSFVNALPQRSQSPQMLPSTSKQAAILKQQQLSKQIMPEQQHSQLQQQYYVKRAQLSMQQFARFSTTEDFFLFRNKAMRERHPDGKDNFNTIPDEIILHIFKWLPKKTLLRCGYVCRRFNRCASDKSLWTRLDLGGRAIKSGAMEYILKRDVVILRLAQATLSHPIFEAQFLESEPNYEFKLQYLDLTMVSTTKTSLKMLLSRCRQLKKLSLESVALNDEICSEISKNTNMEVLNLAMCRGLESWNVQQMMESLKQLKSLNLSWTNLSIHALTCLVTYITPNLRRLNVAGCRKTMFDSHLLSLTKRCPQLLELDLSDCNCLTRNAIPIILKFQMLEYLSLSRCFYIPATAYLELRKMPTLTYLDIFGLVTDTAMEMVEHIFSKIRINKFIHSSVARPTVGNRRTSIWGLRTKD